MKKTQIIILAAGQGKRMGADVPKVLVPVLGKSMISRVLETIQDSKVDTKPIIVVGVNNQDLIKDHTENKYFYAVQEKQLGTGHAVKSAKDLVDSDTEQVLVLFGDQPMITSETIKNLAETHGDAHLTLATTTVPDFLDWRAGFENFSRVIRDEFGKIIKTVEKKDASGDDLKILEVNPAYMVFNPQFLFDNLETLENNNAQGEFYLTDLIERATAGEYIIKTISIDPHEALGANTIEQKELIERILKGE